MADFHHRNNRWLLFIVLCCGWIFLNSLFQGDASSAISGSVLQLLQKVIRFVGGNPGWITMHRVRKAAHFMEYALLGGLLLSAHPKHGKGWLYPALFWGLCIPLLDEGLQLLVPGRTGKVQDVWLDFSGVLVGMGAAYLLHRLWRFGTRNNFKSDVQGQQDE